MARKKKAHHKHKKRRGKMHGTSSIMNGSVAVLASGLGQIASSFGIGLAYKHLNPTGFMGYAIPVGDAVVGGITAGMLKPGFAQHMAIGFGGNGFRVAAARAIPMAGISDPDIKGIEDDIRNRMKEIKVGMIKVGEIRSINDFPMKVGSMNTRDHSDVYEGGGEEHYG